MKVVKQIDIYLKEKRNVKVIDVVQYDTGIQLVFNVKDFSIPSGTTATLYVQKRSGKFVYQEDGITVSTDTITIDLENQSITEHGKTPYQISLKSGSDEITSFTGVMMVEASLKDSGATESKTVIKAFDNAVLERVASFRTQAEQIASAVIATIPEDYTVMTAKVNELANAIKGNLTGAVVFADDVSPVEHIPIVKAHGKNLIDVTGVVTNSDDNIYISEAGVGYLVVTSLSTYSGNGYCQTLKKLKDLCPQLEAGKTYIISATTEPVAWLKCIYLKEYNIFWYFNQPLTITEEMLESIVVFYGLNTMKNQGTGNCKIYNIQIEEGTVVTDYEPYIDPSTVLVSRYARNLLNLSNSSRANCTISGTGIKANIDGLYYCELYANYLKKAVQNMDGHAITFSVGNIVDDCYIAIVIMYTDGTYAQKTGYDTKSVTLWLDHQGRTVQHVIVRPLCKKETFTDTTSIVKDLMIEFAESASEFEVYNGKGYTPVSDGTVEGITSLSPNMTILTDTEGMIVECEYNKDANKVIQKICDALGIEV